MDHARGMRIVQPCFFLECFPPFVSLAARISRVSHETRVCSGPRCVIYLFLEARRERGIELPIMFPGIMGCIRVQLTNAAHLIDSRRSPHLFCRVDDY